MDQWPGGESNSHASKARVSETRASTGSATRPRRPSVRRDGVEPPSPRRERVLRDTRACRCPTDAGESAMAGAPVGFEPTVSTLTRWRALRAAPRGHASRRSSGHSGRRTQTSIGTRIKTGWPARWPIPEERHPRRESNPPVRFGRPVPRPLGQGRVTLAERKEGESNPQGSWLRPLLFEAAGPSPIGLPFLVEEDFLSELQRIVRSEPMHGTDSNRYLRGP